MSFNKTLRDFKKNFSDMKTPKTLKVMNYLVAIMVVLLYGISFLDFIFKVNFQERIPSEF